MTTVGGEVAAKGPSNIQDSKSNASCALAGLMSPVQGGDPLTAGPAPGRLALAPGRL